jgi:hypothetical protein
MRRHVGIGRSLRLFASRIARRTTRACITTTTATTAATAAAAIIIVISIFHFSITLVDLLFIVRIADTTASIASNSSSLIIITFLRFSLTIIKHECKIPFFRTHKQQPIYQNINSSILFDFGKQSTSLFDNPTPSVVHFTQQCQ